MSPVDNRRGILAMSASVVVFIFNDALIKLAAETMPPLQAIGLRGCFATLWCGLALLIRGELRHVPRLAHPWVALRGLLEAGAAVSYLIALAFIPFAIATAVNLSTPLFLAILAVLLLGETVGWRRWTAIAVGFVGVLMVIQPRPGDVNLWTWLVVLASFVGATRDVIARWVPAQVPTLVVSLSSAVTLAVVGCVWATLNGWQPMSLRGVLLVMGSSLLLAAGYQLLMISLRTGAEFSVIGSFRYASVLWALGIGYVLWGDVPNLLAISGIAVVVGAGLYILHRERVRRAGQRATQAS
ncbi:MAG: DMT family transporter [Reyranella sp.]|uniref:DMT family transporter n=1 Tax=Reyranella sp. TaxID=1929291 RepID=UPI001ACE0508|nr:DMT family transporter [Reyranella sp.]MBN9091347.1 DMT family transporter [Reyranella sp.]